MVDVQPTVVEHGRVRRADPDEASLILHRLGLGTSSVEPPISSSGGGL
jgi:hypothetical protein